MRQTLLSALPSLVQAIITTTLGSGYYDCLIFSEEIMGLREFRRITQPQLDVMTLGSNPLSTFSITHEVNSLDFIS